MAMATPYIARLLELSNDIEKNPGPPKGKKWVKCPREKFPL